LRPERLARASQPRLDGSGGDPERIRNLLVAQPFDLAQHDAGPLIEWQAVERAPDAGGQFLLPEHVIRAAVPPGRQLAVRTDVLVERDLLGPPPAPPPALPVLRQVDDVR
jgi:hypothetical protein